MSDQLVDPNTIPEGWTDKMKPHEGADKVSIPSYEEAAASRAPATGNVDEPSANGPTEPVSDEGKYWRDEAMVLRDEVARLKPLEQYSSLIEYLDINEDAAQMVVSHMQGIRGDAGTPVGDMERELYGDDDTNSNAGNVTPQRSTGHADDPNVKSKQHMYNEIQRLMQEEGIESHNIDQHLKFMLTPGEVSPQEMLEMYRTLSASRGKPIGGNNQGQLPKTAKPPVAESSEPAREVSVGNNNMPPPSVAGVSGDNANPSTVPKVSTPQDRLAYDPNNA